MGFLWLGGVLAWEDSPTAIFHGIAIIVVSAFCTIGSVSLASAVLLFFRKPWVRWLFLLDLLLATLIIGINELPDAIRKISSFVAPLEYDQVKLTFWELLCELSVQIETSFLIFALVATCTFGVFRYFNGGGAASR